MKELKIVRELLEELEKNLFFLDDVKVVKAYGKKGALLNLKVGAISTRRFFGWNFQKFVERIKKYRRTNDK